jgi:hypothetical protein
MGTGNTCTPARADFAGKPTCRPMKRLMAKHGGACMEREHHISCTAVYINNNSFITGLSLLTLAPFSPYTTCIYSPNSYSLPLYMTIPSSSIPAQATNSLNTLHLTPIDQVYSQSGKELAKLFKEH